MSTEIEYIAYSGSAYTIEWYFDEVEKSQALDYFQSMNTTEKIQLLKLFKRMGDAGEIRDKTKFRNEGEKIYAFKPQPDRYLCFFYQDSKVIVTNAFRKKQQKLPKNEHNKAVKIRAEYIRRVKLGGYYEEAINNL